MDVLVVRRRRRENEREKESWLEEGVLGFWLMSDAETDWTRGSVWKKKWQERDRGRLLLSLRQGAGTGLFEFGADQGVEPGPWSQNLEPEPGKPWRTESRTQDTGDAGAALENGVCSGAWAWLGC